MRPRLFAILLSLTLVLALVAGLSVDWLPEGDTPPHVLPLSLMAASFLGALVLGFTVKPMPFAPVTSVEPAPGVHGKPSDRAPETPDNRPTLLFIYWPIVIVSLVAAALGPLLLSLPSESGSGLPAGIVLVVGALGLFAAPIVVRYTVRDFSELGFRGFWTSSRRTEWGDGIPPVP